MSKSYRVHVHNHGDQGRWLAQADFAKRPSREQIEAALPVLNKPGRYEVRVTVVQGGNEHHLSGWLQGEYVKDPANPTDAEMTAAIERGLADGSLIDSGEFLAREAGPAHADYPHEPGRLYDCPACEAGCHCTAGYAECVFEGEHNGSAEAQPAAGAVQVKRDGAVQATFDSGDPVKNSNDAFAWLLGHQSQSVDWAVKHEGWEITGSAPEDNADGNPYAQFTPEHRVWAKAQENGKAAASWIFDGNTPQAEYARVLQGIEDGDPEVLDAYREPDLSGEFADDYSEDQLMTDAGWVPHDGTDLRDDLAAQYNSEVSAAFWHEVERLARSGAGTCGDCGCSK